MHISDSAASTQRGLTGCFLALVGLARYSDFCPGLRVSGSGVSCFVAVGCSQSLAQGLWLMGSDFSF